MKLFKIYYLLHSSIYDCYVVAKDVKTAEELVLTTYSKKYNSTFVSIKKVEYTADTSTFHYLEDLIIEGVTND